MSLYDGYTDSKNSKDNKKLKQKILIAIFITLFLIVVLIIGIIYLAGKPKRLSLSLNGKNNSELLSLLDVQVDETGNIQIYAPIKQVASYFGYDANNGSYIEVSEDTNSCNVINEKEVAIFQLDSNIIYKLDLTEENSEYEIAQIDEKVTQRNNELYTSLQGLEKAFNITIDYYQSQNIIIIYTLDQYVADLTTEKEDGTTEIQEYGYKQLDEKFVNQKAIIDNMLVVISDSGKYGVIDYTTGEKVLGTVYDSLTYIPQNNAFLVENQSKYGIISREGETKIKPSYDSLELIDNEKELYLASNGNLYGVININGQIIVPFDYTKIGVDIEEFTTNNITNGYILLDKLIPVCQGEMWGFFNVEGKQVTDLVYNNIGCITTNTQGISSNLLLLQEYDIIIVGKNEKYGGINLNGEEALPIVADDVYMQTSAGEHKYYMTRNQNGQIQTKDIGEYLETQLGLTQN